MCFYFPAHASLFLASIKFATYHSRLSFHLSSFLIFHRKCLRMKTGERYNGLMVEKDITFFVLSRSTPPSSLTRTSYASTRFHPSYSRVEWKVLLGILRLSLPWRRKIPHSPATVLAVSTRFPFNSSDSPSLHRRRNDRSLSLFHLQASFFVPDTSRLLSPGEKRRKHNIITISKSRFLMSPRGHNVPSPRSFVCHSRCFSRRVVDFPLYAWTERKTSNRKTFVARFLILCSETRMCLRAPALLANS